MNVRLMVYNPTGDPNLPEGEKILINPEIIDTDRRTDTFKEGCLSFPGIYANVVVRKIQ